MAPENPPPASPLEKGDETLPEEGNKEPLNQGEKAEAKAEKLTTEYVAKGQKENEHGQQAVAKFVENGKKEGLKIS